MKNLKRRILNGIARHKQEDIYLTEERNEIGTKIATVYYRTGWTPAGGYEGIRVTLKKFIKKRNRYEPVDEQWFQMFNNHSFQEALDYVAKFITK